MREQLEEPRLDGLLNLVVALASGNLGARLEPSPADDTFDAVTTGVNMLAEELEILFGELEERVADRTELLRRANLELEHLALTDVLTGLANRGLLGDRIRQAIARSERGSLPPAVLVLDLDHFKAVNDRLGHLAGDAVLVEVARRLRAVVREVDTVARLGGDEFAILLSDASAAETLRIAERALEAVQTPVQLGGQSSWAGGSIGVRLGALGMTADDLLTDADTAMYVAKSERTGKLQVFVPEMRAAASSRLQNAAELRAAMENRELCLEFQPIVALADGRTIGAEVMVRWPSHCDSGRSSSLVDIADASGPVSELGRWVLQEAVGQLRQWAPDLDGPTGFRLHVNISPVGMRGAGLADYLAHTLDRSGVPADRLAIEFSEAAMMADDGGALNALRRLGLGLVLDNFGSGYSSIGRLRDSAADTVKIDGGLVADIATDDRQATLVGVVLKLVDALGLKAVAEGVETAEQAKILRGLGCEFGQGGHLGAPLPAAAMTALLRRAPSCGRRR